MTLRPLPRAVLAFSAGIIPALRIPFPGAAATFIGVLLAALALWRPRAGAWVAFGAFAAAGAALGRSAAVAAGGDCRARLPDGVRIEARGAFAALASGDGSAPFRLEHVRVGQGEAACPGEVRARLRAGQAAPAAGTAVVGWGRWFAAPPDGRWPRSPDRAGLLLLDSVRVITPAAAERQPLMRIRGAAQQRLRRLLPRRAALAEAMLLARREGIDPEQRDRFARAGLAHLLAISGLHVGLIAGVLLLLGRIARASPRVTAGIAASATVAYVLFLGAPHAAARAALQVVLLLAARLTQRPADPYSLLAAAALALLAADPLAALDPGFQLSFAGTGGIIALRRRFLAALPQGRGRALRDNFATSAAATLATAPITVLHFGQVAPVGLLANLLAIPLVGFAVPALAASLIVGAFHEPAGRFIGGAADLLLGLVDTVADHAAHLPGGHLAVPHDAVAAWALAALLAATLAARLARVPPRPAAPAGPATGFTEPATPGKGIRRGIRRLAAAGIALAVLTAWPAAAVRFHDGALEIHVIDVGQGDAIAIRSPAGRWLLVDAGPRSDRYDAGRARVVPFLLRHGARRLEALVLTHPDADHIGGAAAVLATFPVGLVVDPGYAAGKSLYLDLLREAQRDGIRWIAARADREIRFDGLVLRMLHPGDGVLDGAAEANEVSVAFRLDYGRFGALFLGDLPAAAERDLAARHGAGLGVDLLKVAHHGSRTSTSEALLAVAKPRVAVISVGRRNRYGHPDPGVLDRLARHDVRVIRTDRVGTITIRARPDGRVDVSTQR